MSEYSPKMLVAIGLLGALSLVSCSDSSPRRESGLSFGACGSLVDLKSGPPNERLGKLRFECARLRVPLDYAAPKGEQITLQVVRVRHSKQAKRIGSLILHPGGPGQSGLSIIPYWSTQISEEVLQKFDLVTLDPRGTGASTPVINCGEVPEDDKVRSNPDLRTAAGYAQAVTGAEQFVTLCRAALGDKLKHFTTEASARDLEVLRTRLGAAQLNFVGFSWGAKLGGEYLRQFPDRVRAMVLDAPSDPQLDPLALTERQVAGFEHAFNEYAAGCSARPTCAERIIDPKAFITRLVKAADANPIRSGRRQDTHPATGSQVLDGARALLYDDAGWPFLDDALVEAEAGDSGSLFEAQANLIDDDGNRDPKVARADHAAYVINCNDSAERPAPDRVRAAAVRMAADNPLFGRYGSAFLLGCAYWQPERHVLASPSSPSAPSIVVVGTVHDPATPYAGAIGFARTVGPATLLTWEGEGHTAYLQSPCINLAVDNYLIRLNVPAAGTRCPR